MAEAEDVIVDAARHATVFLQERWRRRAAAPAIPRLEEHARRLELLVTAAFGLALRIRAAQPPAPRTLLRRLFERTPAAAHAVPATDGRTIWLPELLQSEDAARSYRVMALAQGMRAARGIAEVDWPSEAPLVQDLYLLLEAGAAEAALARALPGTASLLTRVREASLAARPPLHAFPASERSLEAFAREALAAPQRLPFADSPSRSLAQARRLSGDFAAVRYRLFKDLWTGELREAPMASPGISVAQEADRRETPPRSARLRRTPKAREPQPGEDEGKPGAWMVQTSQPHEHAEDVMGMQRPTDRDEASAVEELAESVADLPQARLVTRPGSPKEVLLSAEPPAKRAHSETSRNAVGIAYPEWDYRIGAYRSPGAIVRTPPASLGDRAWAAAVLERHAATMHNVRRRFEMLRARRERLHRQLDGEEIDLEACVRSQAEFRAGLPRSERLYQTLRPARRDMALALLVDVSGSTDAWVSGQRRVIDVEREALLLVGIALEAMGERYTVQAFSGEGPGAVTVREIKGFDERHGDAVARRIAALEPERYTRVGAALRHASSLLMREPARHRLLLLLSDGKPNDIDRYEGRYGVEDMRQAVLEAKLQGIFPFCLTVDRAAASYLHGVFGANQYALLPRPELLPTALLDWIRRLASA